MSGSNSIQYLIVGTKEEYERWCEANRHIWVDNPERHVLPHNWQKLQGYKKAKVIIFESALNTKYSHDILTIQKMYEEREP